MKPGDKLWRVPANVNRNGPGEEVTVVSVGRKWVVLDSGGYKPERCLIEEHPTGGHPVDGGQYTSPATCYPDRAAYESKRTLGLCWRAFATLVDGYHVPPPGVDVETIRRVRRELFGEDA